MIYVFFETKLFLLASCKLPNHFYDALIILKKIIIECFEKMMWRSSFEFLNILPNPHLISNNFYSKNLVDSNQKIRKTWWIRTKWSRVVAGILVVQNPIFVIQFRMWRGNPSPNKKAEWEYPNFALDEGSKFFGNFLVKIW